VCVRCDFMVACDKIINLIMNGQVRKMTCDFSACRRMYVCVHVSSIYKIKKKYRSNISLIKLGRPFPIIYMQQFISAVLLPPILFHFLTKCSIHTGLSLVGINNWTCGWWRHLSRSEGIKKCDNIYIIQIWPMAYSYNHYGLKILLQ
jgi:hypothetical protein